MSAFDSAKDSIPGKNAVSPKGVLPGCVQELLFDVKTCMSLKRPLQEILVRVRLLMKPF